MSQFLKCVDKNVPGIMETLEKQFLLDRIRELEEVVEKQIRWISTLNELIHEYNLRLQEYERKEST